MAASSRPPRCRPCHPGKAARRRTRGDRTVPRPTRRTGIARFRRAARVGTSNRACTAGRMPWRYRHRERTSRIPPNLRTHHLPCRAGRMAPHRATNTHRARRSGPLRSPSRSHMAARADRRSGSIQQLPPRARRTMIERSASAYHPSASLLWRSRADQRRSRRPTATTPYGQHRQAGHEERPCQGAGNVRSHIGSRADAKCHVSARRSVVVSQARPVSDGKAPSEHGAGKRAEGQRGPTTDREAPVPSGWRWG